MPLITATPKPTAGLVEVDVDWSEMSLSSYVRVQRVNALTGEVFTLRPHTSYIGDYILLSGKLATFYDTEAPLDTPIYYRTDSLDTPDLFFTTINLFDNFSRTAVTGSWGTPTIGSPWTNVGGSSSDYQISAGTGLHINSSVNQLHTSFTDVGKTDVLVFTSVTVPSAITGNSITIRTALRLVDANNYYEAQIVINTSSAATLEIRGRIAGSSFSYSQIANLPAHTPGAIWHTKFMAVGSTLYAKSWPSNTTEPTDWLLTGFAADITNGTGVGVLSRRETGNTNANLTFAWDNLYAYDVSAANTPTVILASNNNWWLRNPLVPCNNRLIDSDCDTACPPVANISFAGMDSETYSAGGGFLQQENQSLGVNIARPRHGVKSSILLITHTFADRNNVLATLADGNVILFSGPDEYGIPDRYYRVGDVSVSRMSVDHRVPTRLLMLPVDQAKSPNGPAQGVCGTRYMDLCDNPARDTWSEVVSLGLTYDQLLVVSV